MSGARGVATPEAARWAEVAIAITAGLLAGAHVGKMPPALPAVRADLGLDLVTAGWVVSVFAATGAAFGAAAGGVADRLGHRTLLIGGLVLLAAGDFLGALAPWPTLLLASRVVEGAGFLAVVVAAPSVIAAAAGSQRTLALGMWSCYMPTAIAAMLILAPVILAAADWRVAWQALGATTLLWALVVHFRLGRAVGLPAAGGSPSSGGGVAANVVRTLRAPGPVLLALAFPFYTLQWMGVMVWLPTFLIEERALSVATAGLLTALVVAANVPGNLVAGWLMQRGVANATMIAVGAFAMGACALGIFSPALPDGVRYGLCLLFSGVGGALPAAVLSGAPVFAPTRQLIGTVNGLIVQGSNLGQLAGPPALAAVVAASGGWTNVGWLLAGSAMAAVGLAWALAGVRRRQLAAG